MEIPKLQKITVVDIDLNGAHLRGNRNSVIFTTESNLAYSDSEPNDTEWEMTWPEIFEACEAYADANGLK